eukprot:1137420-Pelagomonas_calceolata.AAC.2
MDSQAQVGVRDSVRTVVQLDSDEYKNGLQRQQTQNVHGPGVELLWITEAKGPPTAGLPDPAVMQEACHGQPHYSPPPDSMFMLYACNPGSRLPADEFKQVYIELARASLAHWGCVRCPLECLTDTQCD